MRFAIKVAALTGHKVLTDDVTYQTEANAVNQIESMRRLDIIWLRVNGNRICMPWTAIKYLEVCEDVPRRK